jgi:hypothetical protein
MSSATGASQALHQRTLGRQTLGQQTLGEHTQRQQTPGEQALRQLLNQRIVVLDGTRSRRPASARLTTACSRWCER